MKFSPLTDWLAGGLARWLAGWLASWQTLGTILECPERDSRENETETERERKRENETQRRDSEKGEKGYSFPIFPPGVLSASRGN